MRPSDITDGIIQYRSEVGIAGAEASMRPSDITDGIQVLPMVAP